MARGSPRAHSCCRWRMGWTLYVPWHGPLDCPWLLAQVQGVPGYVDAETLQETMDRQVHVLCPKPPPGPSARPPTLSPAQLPPLHSWPSPGVLEATLISASFPLLTFASVGRKWQRADVPKSPGVLGRAVPLRPQVHHAQDKVTADIADRGFFSTTWWQVPGLAGSFCTSPHPTPTHTPGGQQEQDCPATEETQGWPHTEFKPKHPAAPQSPEPAGKAQEGVQGATWDQVPAWAASSWCPSPLSLQAARHVALHPATPRPAAHSAVVTLIHSPATCCPWALFSAQALLLVPSTWPPGSVPSQTRVSFPLPCPSPADHSVPSTHTH